MTLEAQIYIRDSENCTWRLVCEKWIHACYPYLIWFDGLDLQEYWSQIVVWIWLKLCPGLYAEIGDDISAVRLWTSSARIMLNPRNPAHGEVVMLGVRRRLHRLWHYCYWPLLGGTIVMTLAVLVQLCRYWTHGINCVTVSQYATHVVQSVGHSNVQDTVV